MFSSNAAQVADANFIEDVFSTWLYTGNGGTQTITNGIDLAGKGGLVWMKGRSTTSFHALYDTARGATFEISSDSTAAQTTQSQGLTSFLANGFSIGSRSNINTNAATYASWTFREQAKFFDVVTYTGNGINGTAIPHSLGAVPGCIIIKRTDSTGNWFVHHRSYNGGVNPTQYTLYLNTTDGLQGPGNWSQFQAPTSGAFYPTGGANSNGATYVAYLFAHDAGGFGATGTDNVISCGSFTTDGSGNASVTLGYEPQWVMVKQTNDTGSWFMLDTMRGWSQSDDVRLFANSSTSETTFNQGSPTATGFSAAGFSGSGSFIYIAIRRGPMRTPTTGTSVFGLNARTGTGVNATVTGGQTDDAVLIKNRGSAVASLFSSRLTGTGYLVTSSTAAEVAAGTTILQANPWDVMDGVKVGTTSTITNASGNTFINYLFRRAPGFFDVVCYTGTGVARTVAHNLAVAPELMIVKKRDASDPWTVYYGIATKSLQLNSSGPAPGTDTISWNSTNPTSSVFTVGISDDTNGSGFNFIAYLFASCPGVSRVGSYTGTGATQVINCGFAAGSRFVLIKRTDSTGDWYVWDSARGIVAGNDPYLLLNSTAAEVTTTDWVDTAASGFELSNAGGNLVNINGASYIFLSVS